MKKSIILVIALLISITSLAQQGINYKAVIKDGSGNLLAGTFMNVQFTIHETTETGTIVYQEDHNYTTDANGLLIHNIGSEPTPSVGVFADIDWGADKHFLQVTIAYSGGTINFDATEFMAVPYTKYADKAGEALNVSGLEKITENDGSADNTGWRLVGIDEDKYGPIGENAVDLSVTLSTVSDSDTKGATGDRSVALGFSTTASGANSMASGRGSIASGQDSFASGLITEASGLWSTAMGVRSLASGANSTAMGDETIASGNRSTAMGQHTIASGTSSLAAGEYNIDTPDALFIIGNGDAGFPNDIRSNALTVLKNGTITAPSFDLAEITDDKALVTKEYADANSPTGLEKITGLEGNTGWNLIDTNQSPWIGPLGIDLSISSQVSPRTGALGTYSFAVGYKTAAKGDYSVAMGQSTIATANNSTAIGTFNSSEIDGLFIIGNGTSTLNRNNALTVRDNGDAQFDGEIQHTSTGSANMIPIAYGIVESTGNILANTGNFEADVNSDVFYIDVNDTESLSYGNTVCVITPITSLARTSSTLIADGNSDGDSDLIVRIFNASGTLSATTFQFVIYKL